MGPDEGGITLLSLTDASECNREAKIAMQDKLGRTYTKVWGESVRRAPDLLGICIQDKADVVRTSSRGGAHEVGIQYEALGRICYSEKDVDVIDYCILSS